MISGKARGKFLVPTTHIKKEAALRDPDLPPKGIAVIMRTIENHQRAIAVQGVPVQDNNILRSIDFVMKGGRVFKP